MDELRDVVLLLLVLGTFAFGYFLMVKLDRFSEENRKTIEKETDITEPSYIMLAEDLSEEEIVEEIRQLRKKYESIRIVVYSSFDTELSTEIDLHVGQKQ